MKCTVIEIKQQEQIFYITKLSAKVISKIAEIKRRKHSNDVNVQRSERAHKVKEIAIYCQDPDAIFPTPIIIGTQESLTITNNELELDTNQIIGEILDGQHRILGITKAGMLEDFILPVVIFPKIDTTQKAYIFSTINSTQTKVSPTEIYDLFGVIKGKSPYKLCHTLAEMFLYDNSSPFYKKIKMKSTKQYEEESLSLGTFTNELLSLMSKEPQKDWIDIKNTESLYDNEALPLRTYFIRYAQQDVELEENDSEYVVTMYKILNNYFSAVEKSFPIEWHNPDKYVLSKTTGFGALMKFFPYLYKLGKEQKTFKQDFFYSYFIKIKNHLEKNNKSLTSEIFPSNAQTQNNLKKLFIEIIES